MVRIEHENVAFEFEDILADGALVFEYHKINGKWQLLPRDFVAWLDYWDGHFYRSEEVPEE